MTYRFSAREPFRKTHVFFCIFFTLIILFSQNTQAQDNASDIHEALFKETPYPSAASCRTCHPVHYKEWSVSPHAYAQISPVANAMQAKIIQLTNGTNADFCIRCHTQPGMNLEEPVFASNLDRHAISREGISCVVCHRREFGYGKVSGRLPIEEGDLFEPVYGPHGNEELRRVIESGEYDVNIDPGKEGRDIHRDARQMSQITTSAFCGSCHDVNHVFGFRLEEAFSEYQASPAARNNISCQDCHMGKVAGKPDGYFFEPIAVVGGKPTKPRKRTNHMFVGPDYSIVHPAIFPHNPAAQDIATLREWLKFNYTAGWGTDDFEDNVQAYDKFPERWSRLIDRYEARAIINENLALLGKISEERKKLLQVGYQLGDIVVKKADERGLDFRVEVRNGTEGHNVPTGFDAERIVFLQVTVKARDGNVVFRSGDLDPNGDLRDAHSTYVHNGELPRDKYLFNLQSKFLIRMLRGGEREEVLAVNTSASPLPFIRPATRSTILLGRPDNARKHRMTIAPHQSAWARYKVNRHNLKGSSGPYMANIKLISGMVPVNLIQAIKDVGFDYDMSPRDVADAVVAGHQVLWERDILLVAGSIDEGKPMEKELMANNHLIENKIEVE